MNNSINIFGASSLLTPYLIKRLSLKGFHGKYLGRSKQLKKNPDKGNFTWERLDVTQPGEWFSEEGAVIISLIPLWLLPDFLPRLKYSRQLIAFSTTSIFSKNKSSDPKERLIIQNIIQAEFQIEKFCSCHNLPWTIFRPTLIYDCKNDNNITAMARFIRRWKVFPIAYPGNGLRQPVHANDLAAAAVSAIDNKDAFNRSFNLGGGETLPYREMVKRVYQSIGQQPMILPVPTVLPKAGLKIWNCFRKTNYSPEIFKRMNQDLIFDISAADTALNYNPNSFNPRFR